MINICLIGYGVVGKNFFINFYKKNIYKNLKIIFLIINNNNISNKRKINKILNKKNKIYITKKYRKILFNKRINIFVELTNNYKFSKKITFTLLKKKKFLITANKNLVSLNFIKISKYLNKYIYVEPSVLGGIPIINNFIQHYSMCNIKEITGIFNGTTNFILDNIFRKKKCFIKSLNKSIKKGFSEKKPTFDLGGFDTFYKICILLKILNKNILIRKKNILGILNVKEYFYDFLKKKKYQIILLGRIFFKNFFFSLEVFPYISKKNNIKREYNYITLIANKLGKQKILGKGAGGYATSISVLSNLFNLSRIKTFFIKFYEELDFYKSTIYIILYKKKKYYYKLINLKKINKKTIIMKKINNKRFFFIKKKINLYFSNKIYKIK